jgi:hypothetical protein
MSSKVGKKCFKLWCVLCAVHGTQYTPQVTQYTPQLETLFTTDIKFSLLRNTPSTYAGRQTISQLPE